MLFSLSKISLNVEIIYHPDFSYGTLILLHGFSGSSNDWREVFSDFSLPYKVIAVDLPGHGKSDSPEDLTLYSTFEMTEQLKEIIEIEDEENITLCGYSMGGRLALSFTEKYPSLVSRLILESTSPGIENENERMLRIQSDEELADFIETNPIEKFVERWMNLPLFSSLKNLPDEKQKIHFERKLENNKTGLANSLRSFGTGKMPELWSKLSTIKTNTLLITGEHDEKFTLINKKMCEFLHSAKQVMVKDAGHIVHLEKPKVFVNLITNFIIDE